MRCPLTITCVSFDKLIKAYSKHSSKVFVNNKNLVERKYEIEKIKLKKIKKDELISLQKLINERRNLKLVPFNNIHKFITIKMHDLMKNK